MKNLFQIIFILTFLGSATQVSAHLPQDYKKPKDDSKALELRELCNPATARIELKINNVRAMLLNGGDVWWDKEDGRYIVPNVTPASGVKPVSSIYAAAVWIAGYTSGTLKGAARTYGSNRNMHDWKSGPLHPETGQITVDECSRWDRFFEVTGEEIDEHRRLYAEAVTNGTEYTEDQIPINVRGWPAKGNPYFRSIYNWSLPNTTAALAPFWDNPVGSTPGDYDPADGDYPIIEVRGVGDACKNSDDYQANPPYGDQMFFWIYNDNGGPHTEFDGDPINMEVQVQAYAFKTNDALNDMTFMRYKLVNRAPVIIDNCNFGWWVDSDLGCPEDDMIGCDSARSLVYYYNNDGTDGNTGNPPILCSYNGQSISTYGNRVPIIGIDYFEGPTIDTDTGLVDIGMTSFTYFNNGSSVPQTNDPGTLLECYYYMDAKWKDGSPFTYGGSGYNTGGAVTRYPFGSDPCDINGWSMATTSLSLEDRRTVQSTGPIHLAPSKVNYLVIGVPWVADQKYTGPNNCPSLDDLRAADDICQGLFDNCFQIFDGPDAPDVDIIELDQKVIIALSNDSIRSNNYKLDYAGYNPGISLTKDPEGLFRFEGYQIFQLINPSVSLTDIDNPEVSRLVAQVDLKNDITSIYNWKPLDNPNPKDTIEQIWVPELMVSGDNKGIRNTFEITKDLFATGTQAMVNHKKYFYTAVSYSYNNLEPMTYQGKGMQTTFARGRGNGSVYTGIPRPITDRQLNADYGDGAIITRLDGEGVFSSFLDLASGEHERLFTLNAAGAPLDQKTITYKEKAGPVLVRIYNPVDVIDGELLLTMSDPNPTDNTLDVANAFWTLKDASGNVLVANEDFDVFNEKLIAEYGFSIFFNQNEPGEDRDDINGYMGQRGDYTDPAKAPWLTFMQDGRADAVPQFFSLVFTEATNWIVFNDKDGIVASEDPKNVFEKLSFFPAILALKDDADVGLFSYFTPMPTGSTIKSTAKSASNIARLNNVDIVFTSDKSKWSKCIVVESSNPRYTANGYPTEGGATSFAMRRSRSITKEADANGNPILNANPDSTGFSYFPGYAIDAETGVRLNIFFGENSSFDPNIIGSVLEEAGMNPNICRDMVWNPSGTIIVNGSTNIAAPENYFLGGQHYIYVTNTKYNECATLANLLSGASSNQRKAVAASQVTWVAAPLTTTPLRSYAEGLIPHELIYKVRVNNAYKVPAIADGRTGLNNGMPQYKIEVRGKSFETPNAVLVESALDSISVVPNPYYAYSAYETSEISNVVKITNLPAKALVTIYTLDGKFVRQFNRNESREERSGLNRGVRYAQIIPDIEWDLKNSKGITVASGIYLIHVKTDEGERVIKWVGAIRQLEISGF